MKIPSLVLGLSVLALGTALPLRADGTPGWLKAIGTPKPSARTCSVVIPHAGDDYVTTSKNTAVTFSPLSNDTDTPANDLIAVYQPSHGTTTRVGIDQVRYTPATNYVGSDVFYYDLGGCLQCYQGGCAEPTDTLGTVYVTVTN